MINPKVKPVPEWVHTVTPHLICAGAADALEFYKKAFNAVEMARVPGPQGKLVHACIRIGDSVVMATAFAFVLGVAVASATAEDEPSAQQEMSAEHKAMMEAWEKAAKPGPQHQWLASKVGRWEFAGKFWMEPTKPPTESSGTVERGLMLGGRVLAEKVRSTHMDKPFEGYGLTGYDNVSKEFWGTWNDNMGTGIMLSTGQCDDKGACAHSGSYMDAMTNARKAVRMTSREEGPDREVHQFFEKGPDGKEFKSMELIYTRSK